MRRGIPNPKGDPICGNPAQGCFCFHVECEMPKNGAFFGIPKIRATGFPSILPALSFCVSNTAWLGMAESQDVNKSNADSRMPKNARILGILR